jgi:hypothetical protein
MALTYTYSDAYLKSRVTEDVEDRAIAEVEALGTLPDDWVERLGIIRAYIITCVEMSAKADDAFAEKLKLYKEEWKETLASAKRAQAEANPSVNLPIFTIPVERA